MLVSMVRRRAGPFFFFSSFFSSSRFLSFFLSLLHIKLTPPLFTLRSFPASMDFLEGKREDRRIPLLSYPKLSSLHGAYGNIYSDTSFFYVAKKVPNRCDSLPSYDTF